MQRYALHKDNKAALAVTKNNAGTKTGISLPAVPIPQNEIQQKKAADALPLQNSFLALPATTSEKKFTPQKFALSTVANQQINSTTEAPIQKFVLANQPVSSKQAAENVLQGYFVDENGEKANPEIIKLVRDYIRSNQKNLLGKFNVIASDNVTPRRLNVWTMANLNKTVTAIEQAADSDVETDMEEDEKQPIKSGFSFEPVGRRIETLHSGNMHKDTGFYDALKGSNAVKKPDLSYNDLRDIMEKVLKQHPYLTMDAINEAIKAGVENFDASKKEITLVGSLNADLQLLVQHLLRYQSFNRGELKDTDQNTTENASRRQIMEMSKRSLQSSTTRKDLSRLVPRRPNLQLGAGLDAAMPALIDLNRPLENSVFKEETYKAVFLLAHKLYRLAFDKAQPSPKEKKKKKLTIDESLNRQRGFFNDAMFEILPDMDDSVVKAGKGKDYITKHLGFRYDSSEESFDEGSEESSADEAELPENSMLYHPNDNLFKAGNKRKTALNSFALFSKVSSQKQLLDEQTTENNEKHEKVRRKIHRRTKKLTRKYSARFDTITRETKYYKGKIKAIDAQAVKIENELAVLKRFKDDEVNTVGISKLLKKIKKIQGENNQINKIITDFNKATAKQNATSDLYKEKLEKLAEDLSEYNLKKRILYLEDALERAENLKEKLTGFYSKQKVDTIVKNSNQITRWRKRSSGVFDKLGPKALESYVNPSDATANKKRKKEEDKPSTKRPNKRRRKS